MIQGDLDADRRMDLRKGPTMRAGFIWLRTEPSGVPYQRSKPCRTKSWGISRLDSQESLLHEFRPLYSTHHVNKAKES
jgi:hypothetical protein